MKKFKVYCEYKIEEAKKTAMELLHDKDAQVVYINSVQILRDYSEPYYVVSVNENNIVVELIARYEK